MKLSTYINSVTIFTLAMMTSLHANDSDIPDLLKGFQEGEVQLLTPQEASDTRGESIKKQISKYGQCGFRRCTRMFVNDKHVYTVYDDGSVYFVKH